MTHRSRGFDHSARTIHDASLLPVAAKSMISCCLHKRCKQRMRAHGARLELRMELTAEEPRVFRCFDDFHELAIRREPCEPQTVLRQLFAIRVVHFVAM